MVKLSPAELVDITKYLQEDDRKRALLSRLLQKAAVKMAFRLQIALDAHDIVIARTKEVIKQLFHDLIIMATVSFL